MTDIITSLSGEHTLLAPYNQAHQFILDGKPFWTIEHAMLGKSLANPHLIDWVCEPLSLDETRERADVAPVRTDWTRGTQVTTMRRAVRARFTPGSRPYEVLMGTGDALIAPQSRHHDQFWRDCTCPRHRSIPGENAYGRILMDLRAELRGSAPERTRVTFVDDGLRWADPESQEWAVHCLREVVARLGAQVAIIGLGGVGNLAFAEAAAANHMRLWRYEPHHVRMAEFDEASAARWRSLLGSNAVTRRVTLGEGSLEDVLMHRDQMMVRDADVLIHLHHRASRSGGRAARMVALAHGTRTPVVQLRTADRTVTASHGILGAGASCAKV